jgi:hypothetical protein
MVEKSEVIEMAAPSAAPMPTTKVEGGENKAEHLPLWQILPIVVAMGLGIFLLGLASNLDAVHQMYADNEGPRTTLS